MNDNKFSFSVNKVTWDTHGIPLFFGGKLNFNQEDRGVLRHLLNKNLIPLTYIPYIWYIASGARRQIDNHPNYYDSLVNDYPYYIPSAYENLIALDIPRTFSSEKYYHNPVNVKKLKNVLIAYSRRNVTVGYCQGFNFIVGKLLMIFDSEEKVFWIFAQLIEEYFPPDYFTQIIGVILDSKTVFDYLKSNLKNLNEYNEFIIKTNIPVWLICIFVNKTNDDALYMIWNGLFIDGMASLFTSMIFLIKSFQISTLDCDPSFTSFADKYNRQLLSFNRIDDLRDQLFKKKLLISPKTIDGLRRLNRASLHNEYKKNNAIINKDKGKDVKNLYINESKCNSDWPLCIYDSQYRYDIPEMVVYRTLEKPRVIDEFYFADCGKETGNEIKFDQIKKAWLDPLVLQVKLYCNLVIERRKHNCNSKDHFTYDIYKIITCEDRHKEEYSEKLMESLILTKNETLFPELKTCELESDEAIGLWKELDKSIILPNINSDSEEEHKQSQQETNANDIHIEDND